MIDSDLALTGSRSGRRRYCNWLVVAGVVSLCALAVPFTSAQVDVSQTETATDAAEIQASPTTVEPAPIAASQPKDPMSYGLWVLIPAIVTIVLAIFTRQVVGALAIGVVVGTYMLLPCLATGDAWTTLNPIVGGFRMAAEKYVLGAIIDPSDGFGHVKIMFFTLVIGFMVGVLGRNGGTAGLVKLAAGKTESRRRGALTAWLAGLVVFFDDYANTMIVGPTMRSVFDRLKLSRAKLAYIVDSTAAPVASLAVIGTWVGAEIGYIQQGLDQFTDSTAPSFLLNSQGSVLTGMQAFIASIPYRFYPILALFLVFVLALTGRDFGPMKKSEARSLAGLGEKPYDAGVALAEADQPVPRWWLGLFPVLALVATTIMVMVITGYNAGNGAEIMSRPTPWWTKAFEIINAADTYLSIFYGALASAITAMILTILARACSTRDAVDAGLDGLARMCPALVILVLAWALSAVEQDLMLGEVVTARLQAADFDARWMPLAVFLSAAGISFATGTSWGTMGILCPITVTITVGLAAGIESDDKAVTLFYAAVGSVLAGSVFGDHCSPISDTTVLSSVASGCRHEEHVWTQLPYALLAAVAAVGLGDVMCNVYDQPWYYGLGAGAILLVLVVLVIGRRPKPMEVPAPTTP